MKPPPTIPNSKLIDYDSMQINDHRTSSVSSSLLSYKNTDFMKQELISHQKYLKYNRFTTEINLYSQYVLFFLDILHVDITKINTFYPDGTQITLDNICNLIGLDDWDLQQKLWLLFQDNKENEWLDDDKYTIIDKYNIESQKIMGKEVRKLVKKR